ncbi:sushi, von Willebrand factor type A, EGF and pentraxin domain-containing protein 1-like [Ruditapes philippinarum]|uniref:sushi, von Willebrand factor type A, EGF and pentraxin domain-containing protein 1-like n=1 Tax=Ruditapes philippinarum TaxID=129788 RepID=UPI00295B3D1E|nr:sushi, von Willebrand factor type A, EGF and pentraxin domain-containing protein 1-like [Ruditapes philippinarum]
MGWHETIELRILDSPPSKIPLDNLKKCVGHDVIFKTDFRVETAGACSGSCPITDCDTPDVTDAETFGNLRQIGDVVKLKCLQDGSVSYKECQSDGLWSQQPPCPSSVTTCGTPANIPNSVVTYSSLSIGSAAQYTCLPGFTSSPAGATMSITCLTGGQWEPVSFSCQQVDCGLPGNVANAQRTYTGTTGGSVATFSCISGYEVSPTGASMDVTCLNSGQWDLIGFTCQLVVCGTPPDVTNAQKVFSSSTVGSNVTYTCDSGYTVSPVSSPLSFVCLNTGQWESIGFTCQQVNCGAPLDVANAQKVYSSSTVGSTVTYTCDSGFTVSPVSSPLTIVCLNTGQWESIGFTCQQISCGTPLDVANAQKVYSSATVGSTVTYTCDSGFTVSPVSSPLSFVCLNTGQWETIAFTCQQVNCGTPLNVANAQKVFSATTVGSTVTYTCDSGFMVSPVSSPLSFVCLNTGQWETIAFTCQQVNCGTPLNVANAQKVFSATTVGSTVTYTCDPSYAVSPVNSPLSFACLNTGQWESIGFTCQQVNCGAPLDVANAQKVYSSSTVGSTVTYTCDSGFMVSPVSSPLSFVCLNTGQWETIGFTCQQISCGTPLDVANAQKVFSSTTVGSTVTYTCDSGFTVSPVSSPLSFVCLNTGQWETIGFTCQQISCGTPLDVANAQKVFSSSTAGSTVTYTCNSGFTVSPVSSPLSFVCLNTGQWESIGFTCQQVNCVAPLDVAYAQKVYSSSTVGSIVTYTCDSGFTVSPVSSPLSFVCLNTGQWETVAFTCQQISCGTPLDVANAQKVFSSSTVGSIVTYTCDSGFTVSPVSSPLSFVCLNTGQWETIAFTCQQISCGTPLDVANAQKVYSSSAVGSTVTYTCNSGYAVSPVSSPLSFVCLNTGQWETIGFTCQQVNCGTPPPLFNGQPSYSSTSVGSVAQYSCTSGFLVEPNDAVTSVTCQLSGEWETVEFRCIASVQPGSSCNVDSDCVDPAQRCLYTGLYSIGSRCICKPLYEFNQTLTVCIKVCDSYTSFERYEGQYIRKNNVGDSSGTPLTESECLAFCANNYGNQYLSVDHRHARQYGTNCYCGSATRRQILDSSPDLLYDDSQYTLFTRTCN